MNFIYLPDVIINIDQIVRINKETNTIEFHLINENVSWCLEFKTRKAANKCFDKLLMALEAINLK